MKKIFFFLIAGKLALIFLLGAELYARDEVIICGRVIGIESEVITLRIAQETCRGKRTFRIDPDLRPKIKEDMVICFKSTSLCRDSTEIIIKEEILLLPRVLP